LGISTKPSPGGVRSLPQASSASGVEPEAKRVRSNFRGWVGTGNMGVRLLVGDVVMLICFGGTTDFLEQRIWTLNFGHCG
jgi:hypothetical protein